MKEKTSKITDLLALLVFLLFALCVLLVLLTGARVYRDLVSSGRERQEAQTAVRYVATRVRQAETVTTEDFGGCEALTLRENIGGKTYVTRVYCYGGHLRELYCVESAALSPEDGEKVVEAEQASFVIEGDVLTAAVDSLEVKLYLRCGKETGP